MLPADGTGSQRGPVSEDELARREQELLERVRKVARQITERVAKTLGDTETHPALPTEENPPLA